MNPPPERTKAYRERYKELGLVQITAWVPRESRAKVVETIRLLREEHLAKQVLQRPKGPTEVLKA